MAVLEENKKIAKIAARLLQQKITHYLKKKPTEEELNFIYHMRDKIVKLDPQCSYINTDITYMLLHHYPPYNPNIIVN